MCSLCGQLGVSVRWLALLILWGLAGCATTAMPTPNLYSQDGISPFLDIAPSLQSDEVQVLYATDRAPELADDGSVHYGFGRSMSPAYGNATVRLGEGLSWEELDTLSSQSAGARKREPAVTSVRELDRMTDTRERLTIQDGLVGLEQEEEAELLGRVAAFHEELRRRLSQSPTKAVYVYVHGYSVSFDQAVTDVAQLYHFLGRRGVPIAYTWPAGHGGLLRGYNADRESSEFTVFHFKQFLTALAQCSELEEINIIAHSRGTDLTITALRELYLYHQGLGDDTASALKLKNVVLAAPDLDFEVFQQRFGAERVINAMQSFTLYLSETDKALGLATWLFDSMRRLGRVRATDLTDEQLSLIGRMPNVAIIDVKIKRNDFLGHGYFLMDPAVNSDLILLLRDGLKPGSVPGRPLKPEGGGFWSLNDTNYPATPTDSKE